ncbi:MAG: CO dehydrogenase nickel-insertion accessory protein CooC [Thermoproteota archaeon]|uniref:CO dehydrogenase nickel-insertion accessory protein CooC n=2 Tax=Candidatus Methanodesulfokora washburnensis TaxID=2478471 RepID=A0A429GPY2_9CREN|nr:CO dehydrogenase nickel-insertion accessory protein CooC [Candidatus Methanodesulfokores washburnensis]RZN62127.1 MAG: CO dehydrogenase nickel-insertion accessory protein CooC [Candidatus Methanodesulfokores washburnensis]TDA41732.1 MAG: CO dehydrogenase nickel-insertion accessory protein CooC [Candidatus Korarchaeota archaeon]
MKILVAGKGGTGKTTVSALLSHFFCSSGHDVLALDTDSTPNLAMSIGVSPDISKSIVPLVKNEDLVEERTGARPGESWGVFFNLSPEVEDIVEKYGIKIKDKLSLLVVGSIDSAKQGCLCPAIALARSLLKHILLKNDQIVIVDAEAGAEVFGRGLAEDFDYMLCMSEPTLRSLEISKNLIRMADELGIRNNVLVVNKVVDEERAIRLVKRVVPGVRSFFVGYDPEMSSYEEEGLSVERYPKNSPVVVGVRRMFDLLFGR